MERVAHLVGVLLLLSGLIHLAVLALGGGTWMGPLSLRKPTTFGLSFGFTLMTIAWTSSFLRLGDRARAMLLGIFTAACVIETALVSLQAWRAVPSHFNMETTFDGLVTRMLAAGGIILVVIIAVMTLASFRSNPALPIGLRIAIRIGFGTLFSSMVVGALMIASGIVLVVAGDAQAAYATGGTLKPTHAVTMHAILVLPLLAWLLSMTDWNERRQTSDTFPCHRRLRRVRWGRRDWEFRRLGAGPDSNRHHRDRRSRAHAADRGRYRCPRRGRAIDACGHGMTSEGNARVRRSRRRS